MISLWVVIGLIIAAISISTLGAVFSIVGLGALFSGAVKAVWVMSGSLEFAKFVLAAYLHQRWQHLKLAFKFYLVFSVVILSAITSMGIFGFLSNAYQSATSALESEAVILSSLKTQQINNLAEFNRLNKSVENIPSTRVSMRIKAQAEIEPALLALTKEKNLLEDQVTKSNLKILEIKQAVGPLIYVSRAFNVDIDTVVKYLILLLMLVIDPLAICLVIATSEALQSRKTLNSVVTMSSMGQDEVIQMHFVDDSTPPKTGT
jgi:hypothetical protein